MAASTPTETWIVIPNWEGPTGFQHYKDRTPRWIKNYVELMSDDAYLGLTLHQRGVLHGLWLEYAAARRQIPDSTLVITRRLGQRVTRATLDALNHAGFILYSASDSLAEPAQPASPDKRREEKELRAVRELHYAEPEPSLHDDEPPTTVNRQPSDIAHAQVRTLIHTTLPQRKGAATA